MLHSPNSHERYLAPGRYLGASGFDGPVNGGRSDGNEKELYEELSEQAALEKGTIEAGGPQNAESTAQHDRKQSHENGVILAHQKGNIENTP